MALSVGGKLSPLKGALACRPGAEVDLGAAAPDSWVTMRDGNRLKEKIELRLDRRQVTSLAVVALLLSATVFALGVMVGKNLAPIAHPVANPEALLDRLDAQADAGQGSSPSESLTFQEELTKKLPTSPPLAKTTPLPRPPASKLVEVVPHVAAAPAPPAITAEGTRVRPATDRVSPSIVLAEPDDSGVEVAVAPKLPLPQAPPRAFFTVQVKATQSSTEADKFAQRLRSQGFQPLVAEAQLPGKGRWYRVRVGRFENRPQADHYLVDFKRETHLEAFVTAAGH